MAFPAYKFMDIPESQVEDEESQSIISRPSSELLEILPPIIYSFLENVTISELLARLGLEISTQRVDDIPVILATWLKMDIPNQIDSCFKTHGARCGLSLGWLITVWLVYIISQQDHRMNHVRDWVKKRRDVLECLIGQSISETDFTDDRLADGLRSARQLASWNSFETELSQRTIRVYDLTSSQVRLDATTASTHHDPNHSNLFKVGRSKDGTYNPQFKIMLATLDPLGMPIGLDVVAGNLSDDPLYLPLYNRIRDILSQPGLLYIGDCKMAALYTRATIVSNNDRYLIPLPQTGHNPELLARQIERVIDGEVKMIEIYHAKDIAQDPSQKCDPNKRLAQGSRFTRSQTATVNEKEINWNERVLVVCSDSYAASQIKLSSRRLLRAERALLALTPPLRENADVANIVN